MASPTPDLQILKRKKESVHDRLERYEGYFNLSSEQLHLLYSDFLDELQVGLYAYRRHPHVWKPEECSFKMLDSCINNLPTGNEKGVFYGLDFGGTNFRAVRAELQGQGKLQTTEVKRVVATAVNKEGCPLASQDSTASDMFDYFSDTVKELMSEKGDLVSSETGRQIGARPAGFTFSFPCVQRGLNSALLLEWTKHFTTGRATSDPVEGSDVAELMNFGFERNRVPAYVSAVINDTVGTLLSTSYTIDRKKHPPCLVGIILGTGVNACYVEKNAREYGYVGRIINIECGNFNRSLPQTAIDHSVDQSSKSNIGKQKLEKMLSGAYLGEICRRGIIKILEHRAPANAWIPQTVSAEAAANMLADKTADFSEVRKTLWDIWELTESEIDSELPEIAHRVCKFVFSRSAALAAVIVAATAKKTGHLQRAMGGLTLGVDGSLYKMVEFYRDRFDHYLKQILNEEISSLIYIAEADDGSGKGAAILAGALACQ